MRWYCPPCCAGWHELCGACVDRLLVATEEPNYEHEECPCEARICDACVTSHHELCIHCVEFRVRWLRNEVVPRGSTDLGLAGLGRNCKGDGPDVGVDRGHVEGAVFYGTFDGRKSMGVLVRRVRADEVRFIIPPLPDSANVTRARAREGSEWLLCQCVVRANLHGLTRKPRGRAVYRAWAPPDCEPNSPLWLPSPTEVEEWATTLPGEEGPVDMSLTLDSTIEPPPGLPAPAGRLDWQESLAFFDGVSYNDSVTFRVITSEIIPPTLRVAVADARSKVIIALANAERLSVQESRLWKCLTLVDRLLFCVRPGGRRVRRGGVKHASHKGQGWHRALSHRVHLLECGDWAGLMREAVPWEPPAERSAGGAADPSRQAKRVELLVANREVSKAVSFVRRNEGQQPQSEEELKKLLLLFPDLPADLAPDIAQMAAGGFPIELRESLEAAICKCILRAPKLSGPGPTDSRFEHWEVLRENPTGLKAAGQVLARLLLGELPGEAVDAHLAGRLVGIPKADGGVRPLACGSAARRLAAKGACLVFADGLAEACGEAQYAVGRVGGAEKLHKTLTLLAELRPDALFVKLDFRNAYNSILRSSIREAVATRAPALDCVAATLCPVLTEHVWFDAEGRGRRVPAVRGVDQGCPLSPALFAIGVAPVLETLRTELRTRDAAAQVLSYLDDIHVVIAPQLAAAAVERARELFAPLGLQLHDGKQKVWSPRPHGLPPLPGSLAISDTFTCLGASALWVDEECARVDLAGPGTRLQRSLEALATFSAQLMLLRAHGLSLATALTVHRAWAGGHNHASPTQ